MLVRVKGNVIFQKTNTVNVTDLKKPGWNVVLNVTSSQNWDIRPDGYFGRILYDYHSSKYVIFSSLKLLDGIFSS